MNLPLHLGWAGALEAGLIAFAIGLLAYAVFHRIAARGGWPEGHAIGWAGLAAVVVGAGIDAWNLFYLGVVGLESPLYARIALARIHDADNVGTRAFLEWTGALSGVVAGWIMVRERRQASPSLTIRPLPSSIFTRSKPGPLR